LLLTLDPLAAMAQADQEQVMALLETVRTDSVAVATLLERVADRSMAGDRRDTRDGSTRRRRSIRRTS